MAMKLILIVAIAVVQFSLTAQAKAKPQEEAAATLLPVLPPRSASRPPPPRSPSLAPTRLPPRSPGTLVPEASTWALINTIKPSFSNFYVTLYKWLISEKYEILSRDNEFVSPDRVLLFLVPRIGPKAAELLVKNCMRTGSKYEETLLHFAICSLVVLDEMSQRRSLF